MLRSRLLGPRKLEVIQSDAPSPEPHQVLIRLRSALVDENQLRDFRRGVSVAATAVSGEVLQPGANVIGTKMGQSVVAFVHGPLADYVVADENLVVPFSESSEAACLLPWIGKAHAALVEGESSPEATVVMGAGFYGLALTALMKTTCPLVVGCVPDALELAEELGAVQSFEEGLGDLSEHLGPVGAELVLESSGSPELFELAQSHLAKGGTLRLLTDSLAELRADCTRLHYDQLTLCGSGPLRREDLSAAQTRLEELPDRLLSGKAPLSALPNLMMRMDQGEGVSFLVVPEGDT